MTSSKPRMTTAKLSVLLRVPEAKDEQPHEALANMAETPEAVQTFEKRWGSVTGEEGTMDAVACRNALRIYWKSSPGVPLALSHQGSEFGEPEHIPIKFEVVRGKLVF